jgi:hypothetical protein
MPPPMSIPPLMLMAPLPVAAAAEAELVIIMEPIEVIDMLLISIAVLWWG